MQREGTCQGSPSERADTSGLPEGAPLCGRSWKPLAATARDKEEAYVMSSLLGLSRY